MNESSESNFTRDTQGAALTPFGKILLVAGRELLDLRDEVLDMLKDLRAGEITPLNLGFSSLVGNRTLASITDTIQSMFPQCVVLSDSDELPSLEARVESGDLDEALRDTFHKKPFRFHDLYRRAKTADRLHTIR